MGALHHDVRYALRLLAQKPASSGAILLTLALGIGATAAVFSVVQVVLLRALPYSRPDQLVVVHEQRPAERNLANSVSPADFLDWQATSSAFSRMAAYNADTVDVTGIGDPVQVPSASVSVEFFDMLGVTPLLGRTFRTGEDLPGERRVAILSHRLWRQRFGSDPSVTTRQIVLDGVPHDVIAVLGPDFEFPGEVADVWTPLVLRGGQGPPPRALHYLEVFARLEEGVSVEHAQGELTRIGDQLAATYPENEGHGPRVVSLRDEIVEPARAGLLLVLSAVAFLMLIACANVANLLLARSAGRRRELAIRAAVGAARGRLLRQTFTESGVLAFLGGALGLFVGWWTLQLLVLETPLALRGVGLERARFDVPVLLFTAAVCSVTALLAGALPAWQVTRTQPADPLREVGGRSPLALRRGVRMTLIAAQVALTVLLLIGAGLMVRTFIRVLSEPTGFHTAGRLTVNLTLPPSRYGDADAIRRGRQALDERFAAIAGVFAFGVNNNLPLSGSDSRRGITVEGLQRTPGDDPVRAHTRIVTPGYFAAAGIATREGRLFTGADDERAPLVVLINETMARRYWPGQSPIGKRIRFNSEGDPWRQVIGVIGDVKHWGLDREVNPETYLPHAQQPSATLTYVFHTVGNPLTIISPLAAAVREVDPDLPLGSVRTFDQVAAAAMATRRWSAMLLGVLALLGIGLAAAGVYGVMSHVVTLQAAEISIRLSLGATRGAVLRRVLADAVVNTSVGVILGLLAGVAFAQLLQSLLFGVTPLDPATFSAAAGLVIVAAVLAALAPALTAMRIDPAEALRQS